MINKIRFNRIGVYGINMFKHYLIQSKIWIHNWNRGMYIDMIRNISKMINKRTYIYIYILVIIDEIKLGYIKVTATNKYKHF